MPYPRYGQERRGGDHRRDEVDSVDEVSGALPETIENDFHEFLGQPVANG